MKIVLNGMKDAQKQMARIERGTAAMDRYTAVVFSRLPYAYGQEFGRHRKSQKLARRAGGDFYMQRAVDTVVSGMDKDISEGLMKVTAPGKWVMRRLALWARRLARKNAPRKPRGLKKSHKYRLWRSIRSEVRRK